MVGPCCRSSSVVDLTKRSLCSPPRVAIQLEILIVASTSEKDDVFTILLVIIESGTRCVGGSGYRSGAFQAL